MFGKAKFLTKLSHQFVDERLAMICDNISRHAISIDGVHPNEVNSILILNFNLITSAYSEK